MSLKDIIAAKKLQISLSIPVENVKEEIEEIEIIEGFTDYYNAYSRKEFSQEEKDLFFSLYAPYIREPYKFDWFTFRDYFSLFFPDGAFVINTFRPLNIERIFNYYLEYNEPLNLHETTVLCHFVNHMHLMIPVEFEGRIINLISSWKEIP